MNPKVYIVVTPFFPSSGNWRGSYCYDFVVALKKTGRYKVEVFVPGCGADYEIGGVTVHRFATKQLPSNIFPLLYAGRNQNSFIAAVERAGIDLEDVAVCHGHTANCSIYPLALKEKNPKCLTLLHHHDPESFGLGMGVFKHCWPYNMVAFPSLRKRLEEVDVHVFISTVVKKSFSYAPDASWSYYDGYKAQMRGLPYRPVKTKNSVILHNGVDLSIFKAGEKIAHDGFVIGCIGNFIDWKDQMTLLKAVELLSRVENVDHVEGLTVILIGSGPERANCEEYARGHGINAEFRDEVRHKQLPEFYRSIDLFVLPSYFEGFGCVFTEAWACGTPFITCEGQGMDDMIYDEDRETWLCKPNDPEDLAKKIKHYFDKRPVQRLKSEVDIDKLVPKFVEEIEAIRGQELGVRS